MQTRHERVPAGQNAETIAWIDGPPGVLRLLDQTRLPQEADYVFCKTTEQVWEAIHTLRVRGAPAIGVAAAYGVVLGIQEHGPNKLREVIDHLRTSRPTAVNLFWALDRMVKVAAAFCPGPDSSLVEVLLAEAKAIHQEDITTCKALGEFGAELIPNGAGVLTHCNTGALATAGEGTALNAVFTAHRQGKKLHVFVDETRPLLQGARLTAWELQQRNIPCTLICDNMAAQVMKEGKVQLVLVGADRIAANGDTANKIGTYGLAVLAQAHNIPFYVVAPRSTFDLSLPSGDAIPIEQRDPKEITHSLGRVTAPADVIVYNPAFDVTPARSITGIVTEVGLIQPVTSERIVAQSRG